MRLTPAQRRAMAILASGRLLRMRGYFGKQQAALGPDEPEWPHVRTIACLLQKGLIEPGEFWGTFRAKRGE